jgi:agmatine/peptidylarginine deiminase
VLQLEATNLIHGDGIHCITQQQPAAAALDSGAA